MNNKSKRCEIHQRTGIAQNKCGSGGIKGGAETVVRTGGFARHTFRAHNKLARQTGGSLGQTEVRWTEKGQLGDRKRHWKVKDDENDQRLLGTAAAPSARFPARASRQGRSLAEVAVPSDGSSPVLGIGEVDERRGGRQADRNCVLTRHGSLRACPPEPVGPCKSVYPANRDRCPSLSKVERHVARSSRDQSVSSRPSLWVAERW